MTTQEFSNTFDTLLNSYNTQGLFGEQASRGEIVLDEYEKSVFLTIAQEDIVVSLYNGLNLNQESFEGSEEVRRYLDTLVKTIKTSTPLTNITSGANANSVFFSLPTNTDVWFIVYEAVNLQDNNLKCTGKQEVPVIPTKHDNLQKVLRNPFRRPNERRVLRLDLTGNMVELISKYHISDYILRYISKPEPIVLVNLPDDLEINGVNTVNECKLNSVIHRSILEKAVQFALTSKLGTIQK